MTWKNIPGLSNQVVSSSDIPQAAETGLQRTETAFVNADTASTALLPAKVCADMSFCGSPMCQDFRGARGGSQTGQPTCRWTWASFRKIHAEPHLLQPRSSKEMINRHCWNLYCKGKGEPLCISHPASAHPTDSTFSTPSSTASIAKGSLEQPLCDHVTQLAVKWVLPEIWEGG